LASRGRRHRFVVVGSRGMSMEYLKAKEEEELWKLKYCTMIKYNVQKIL
jgi:hypothetical protein